MRLDRRLLWVLVLALLILLLWYALDHVLFPTLPVPAGVTPIAK
jgi:hypothetical protein